MKDYIMKVWLPYRLPVLILLGSPFVLCEYLTSKVVFSIGYLRFNNIQVYLGIICIVAVLYVRIVSK